MVSPVCTTTDPNNPGKMYFHVGHDHPGQTNAVGQVCITPPGEGEQCFSFTEGYSVLTDPYDTAGDCIIGQMQDNYPGYTADTVITCYSGAEFVTVNDAPNANPVQATTVPLNGCDPMYPGRYWEHDKKLAYMFTAEVTGAESGTYYIRTHSTNYVMDPCTEFNEANDPAVYHSDLYTCAPGAVTYRINMAVASVGSPCLDAPVQAAGTVPESYSSCQPNAFNGFVCPVLCAGQGSTMSGILKCTEGVWEDSIVCVGAQTPAPTAYPTKMPSPAPTPMPTLSPTSTPTTAAPTFMPTAFPTQSPIPCTTTTDNDIVFVMDASGSVTIEEWGMMLDFVEETVVEFIPDNSRVAVTGYSTEGYLHFDLEAHATTTTDRALIASSVLATPKITGSTNTLSGLEFALNNVIAPASVEGRTTKLFLLTDGASPQDTCSIVKSLQDSNVHVTLVTIGDDWALETRYECLVNSPEDHIYLGAGYDYMETIFAPFEESLCAELTSFPSVPPTSMPTTGSPTSMPTTGSPTSAPTSMPTTSAPTSMPTTAAPTTRWRPIPAATPKPKPAPKSSKPCSESSSSSSEDECETVEVVKEWCEGCVGVDGVDEATALAERLSSAEDCDDDKPTVEDEDEDKPTVEGFEDEDKPTVEEDSSSSSEEEDKPEPKASASEEKASSSSEDEDKPDPKASSSSEEEAAPAPRK